MDALVSRRTLPMTNIPGSGVYCILLLIGKAHVISLAVQPVSVFVVYKLALLGGHQESVKVNLCPGDLCRGIKRSVWFYGPPIIGCNTLIILIIDQCHQAA